MEQVGHRPERSLHCLLMCLKVLQFRGWNSASALMEANAEKYIFYFEWILDESEFELCRLSFRTKWKSISILYSVRWEC